MSKIAILAIDGVEEVECLTTVDFCRRAGIEVTLVSVTGRWDVIGSHQITFRTDALLEEIDFESYDGVVFPGGPGTGALGKTEGMRKLAEAFLTEGKLLAAICAAPGMLSESGMLKEKTATGYPGCKPAGMALWTEQMTETDNNLITGKGPGAAPLFALEIIRYLEGDAKAQEIRMSAMMP